MTTATTVKQFVDIMLAGPPVVDVDAPDHIDVVRKLSGVTNRTLEQDARSAAIKLGAFGLENILMATDTITSSRFDSQSNKSTNEAPADIETRTQSAGATASISHISDVELKRQNVALVTAAASGDQVGVKAALAAGANVRTRQSTALYRAAVNGHVDLIPLLVAAGAEVNVNNADIFRAVAVDGNVAVLSALWIAGADVHALGEAALYQTIANKHMEALRFLIEEAGADPHAFDEFALRTAMTKDNDAAVRFLLSHGADPATAWLAMSKDEQKSATAMLDACADAMSSEQCASLTMLSERFDKLRAIAESARKRQLLQAELSNDQTGTSLTGGVSHRAQFNKNLPIPAANKPDTTVLSNPKPALF